MKVPEMNTLDILDRITDGFYSRDKNWRLTQINKVACKLLMCNREDLIGKNIWDEYPQAVGLPLYEQYKKAMAELSSVSLEAYFRLLGTWFDVNVYPSDSGLSVFIKDITEKKQLLTQNE